MTELNRDEELRCIGCGAVIQTEDEGRLGLHAGVGTEQRAGNR